MTRPPIIAFCLSDGHCVHQKAAPLAKAKKKPPQGNDIELESGARAKAHKDNVTRLIQIKLAGLVYKEETKVDPVPPRRVTQGDKPEEYGTPSYQETKAKGGSDCDGLALATAHLMKEGGVMGGYQFKNGKYYSHAVYARINKKDPQNWIFTLYEVSDPKNPSLIGSFSYNPNAPKKTQIKGLMVGDFVPNVYFGVKSGKPDFSNKHYFVPEPKKLPLPPLPEINSPIKIKRIEIPSILG